MRVDSCNMETLFGLQIKYCKKLLCPVSNLAFADLEGIRTNYVLIIPWELHIEVAQDYDAIVEAARTQKLFQLLE